VLLAHEAVSQFTEAAASKTRDRKTPEPAYGLILIQSTDIPLPPVFESIANGRIVLVMETGWVATTLPSTEKTMLEAFQSIR
jgi:hypothetical protein